MRPRTSLAVHTPNAGGMGFIPGQETRSHTLHSAAENKNQAHRSPLKQSYLSQHKPCKGDLCTDAPGGRFPRVSLELRLSTVVRPSRNRAPCPREADFLVPGRRWGSITFVLPEPIPVYHSPPPHTHCPPSAPVLGEDLNSSSLGGRCAWMSSGALGRKTRGGQRRMGQL